MFWCFYQSMEGVTGKSNCGWNHGFFMNTFRCLLQTSPFILRVNNLAIVAKHWDLILPRGCSWVLIHGGLNGDRIWTELASIIKHLDFGLDVYHPWYGENIRGYDICIVMIYIYVYMYNYIYSIYIPIFIHITYAFRVHPICVPHFSPAQSHDLGAYLGHGRVDLLVIMAWHGASRHSKSNWWDWRLQQMDHQSLDDQVLVGGIPLWKMMEFVSWDLLIPNIW